MDSITTMLMGGVDFALNANFICNVVVLVIVLESISVICANFASLGR